MNAPFGHLTCRDDRHVRRSRCMPLPPQRRAVRSRPRPRLRRARSRRVPPLWPRIPLHPRRRRRRRLRRRPSASHASAPTSAAPPPTPTAQRSCVTTTNGCPTPVRHPNIRGLTINASGPSAFRRTPLMSAAKYSVPVSANSAPTPSFLRCANEIRCRRGKAPGSANCGAFLIISSWAFLADAIAFSPGPCHCR